MSRFDYNMEAIKAKLTTPMPKHPPEDRDLFPVKEAAQYFGLHEETLRQKIRKGEIEVVRPSPRKTFVHREEIYRFWNKIL